MATYEEVKGKELEGIKHSLIGNCKRLIYILENTPNEEIVERYNYKLGAEIKNKTKEIRRDTMMLSNILR